MKLANCVALWQTRFLLIIILYYAKGST